MSEQSKFEQYRKKVQGLCDEHDLVFTFRKDGYPITLTIRPTDGVGEQMDLLSKADDQPFLHPDSKLVFYMEDGELKYEISERFVIADSLFSKFKNLFKNMHYTWLQFVFRALIERGTVSAESIPDIPDEDEEEEDEQDQEQEEDPDEDEDEEEEDDEDPDADNWDRLSAEMLGPDFVD